MASAITLPKTVILLGLTSFLTDVGTEMIFPLLPAFLAGLGAGAMFLGVLEGVADAVSSFLKLGAGAWSDRLSRKKPILLWGYGLSGFAKPFVAFATAPWHVLVVRVIDRVGKGIRTAPRDVLIARSTPRASIGWAYGFHRAMDHAGAVTGPLLAAVLLAWGLSLPSIFLAAAIPGFLAVMAIVAIRETPVSEATSTDGDAVSPREHPTAKLEELVAAQADPVGPGDAPTPPLPIAPLHVPKGDPMLAASGGSGFAGLPVALYAYLAVLFVFAIGNATDGFLLLRAQVLLSTGTEGEGGVATVGVLTQLTGLWVVFHVSKVSSSLLGGWLADRIPPPVLIALGFAVYAASYAGFAMANAAWQVWALFAFYGLYYGLTESPEKALVRVLAPEAAQGKAFGAYHFVIGATAIPAGLVTGLIWDTASLGPGVALGLGACMAGVAGCGMVLWALRYGWRGERAV